MNTQLLNSLPAAQKMALLKQLAGNMRTKTFNNYFSTVRFQAAVSGTFLYTFAAGTELRAFGYAQGDPMNTAVIGFPAGRVATPADTNLISSSETISGEQVLIEGLSIMPHEDSDAQLMQVLWPNVSVTLQLNGAQLQFPIGTLAMMPGSGGLSGTGTSYVTAPDIASSVARPVGALQNGWATVDNFYPFPEPVIWQPKGGADSTLIVKLRVEQASTYQTLLTADRAAAAGIAAWTHPSGTALGTYVDVKVRLWSRQISPRSQNA